MTLCSIFSHATHTFIVQNLNTVLVISKSLPTQLKGLGLVQAAVTECWSGKRFGTVQCALNSKVCTLVCLGMTQRLVYTVLHNVYTRHTVCKD